MNHQHDAPVSITSARAGRSEDIRRREIRYLLSMGIRTVCFVLAIVTHGPLRWIFVSAAVSLPYLAVVIANATDRRGAARPASYVTSESRPEITSSPEPEDHDERAG